MAYFQIPFTGFQIPRTNFQIPNTNYQVPIAKYQLQNDTTDFLNILGWLWDGLCCFLHDMGLFLYDFAVDFLNGFWVIFWLSLAGTSQGSTQNTTGSIWAAQELQTKNERNKKNNRHFDISWLLRTAHRA